MIERIENTQYDVVIPRDVSSHLEIARSAGLSRSSRSSAYYVEEEAVRVCASIPRWCQA